MPVKMKQMRLSHFCAEYDIPRTTALEWAHSQGFPAFKLANRWYVDIPAYEKWRNAEHLRRWKYA